MQTIQRSDLAKPVNRAPTRAVAGWVLYDLANTIFAMTILSLYFPLFVVNDRGGKDSDLGFATGLAMFLVFVSAPFLGALSDQTRKRLPFLLTTTVVCVGFTAFLGRGSLGTSLVLFVVATYFYEAGLIFYDSLLPAVSTEENRGWIGGVGVGVGYFGSFIGVATGIIAIAILGEVAAKPVIFLSTAILFLLFALPCFLFVREPKISDAKRFGLESAMGALRQLRQTVRLARSYRGLPRFLFGRMFYTDAANTLIIFLGIYVTNELGFTQTEVQILLFIGILFAVFGGFGFGRIVDRIGPKRSLNIALWLWTISLIAGVAVPFLALPNWIFWLLGPMVGVALGATWSADRPYMLRLSPPRYLGQFYGLYAMVGRFSAVVGPLMWSAIVNGLGFGRPVALGSLAIMMLISLFVLRRVTDEPRAWGPEDRLPDETSAVIIRPSELT